MQCLNSSMFSNNYVNCTVSYTSTFPTQNISVDFGDKTKYTGKIVKYKYGRTSKYFNWFLELGD